MLGSRLPKTAGELLAELRTLDRTIEAKREEFGQEVTSVTKALADARHHFEEVEGQQKEIIARAERRIADADRAIALVEERREEVERAIEALVHDKVSGFEFIARAWADYELALSESQAGALIVKRRPAKKAADAVREKGRQLAETRRRAKLAEWIVALYEFHFPWLEELRSFDEEESYIAHVDLEEDSQSDPARHWLSAQEWTALPEVERNQRALERYLHSRQSPWQLGRDYERYVGYLREQDGCRVTYHGIAKGLEDLGRDLLAEKGGTIEVIQCKRWAQHKEIHEKHVFQLFGTMTAARIENPGVHVIGTFTTTTWLSERARQFADVLGIRVEENFPLADYPRIKCNVARQTGERIYHLPFDQQYDSTVIEPERGEHYAMTCAEAEALGFRRAWRWRGAKA